MLAAGQVEPAPAPLRVPELAPLALADRVKREDDETTLRQVDVEDLVVVGRLADRRVAAGAEDRRHRPGDPLGSVQQGRHEVAGEALVDELLDRIIGLFDPSRRLHHRDDRLLGEAVQALEEDPAERSLEVFQVGLRLDGGEAGATAFFQASGRVEDLPMDLAPDLVLVVGPGGGKTLAADASAVTAWLKAGGSVLTLGLDEPDANAFLPSPVRMRKAEHIAAFFPPFDAGSPLAGVGPADVHNRDPRDLPLVAGGVTAIGDGVLARAEGLNVDFCQLAPWQFEYADKPNIKRTFRRTSFLVSRLLANRGVEAATPILARFSTPVAAALAEKRWLDGLYLDVPEEMDDPYRFFRWLSPGGAESVNRPRSPRPRRGAWRSRRTRGGRIVRHGRGNGPASRIDGS
jgi:hypothetical protein